MAPSLQRLTLALVALSALFLVLQRRWPAVTGQRALRKGVATDLCYWAFTPLVTRAVTPLVVGLALAPLALAHGLELRELRSLAQGRGPLGEQPLWLQAIQILILGDFIGYWQHRWSHGGWRWRFHAVHHSSEQLDWLSAVRLHPVNGALSRAVQAVPIVALGYNAGAVGLFSGFTALYALALHANLSWRFGPLRYVIASPAFHRWHHASDGEARGKNFAGLFPVWDLLFGTFHMPDRQPRAFGAGEAVPEGLLGQLAYPFRRRA